MDRARIAREHVRQGRTRVRQNEYSAALEEFRLAIEAMPRAPQLRCEAGYVAFRAERLVRAAEELDFALRLFGDPERLEPALKNSLAMCLYNRGLVYEALSNEAEASDAFARSLALRPHPAVQRHLDAIDSQHRVTRIDAPDAESLLSELSTSFCGTDCDEPDECTQPSYAEMQEGLGVGDATFTPTVITMPGCQLDDLALMMAIRTGEHWSLMKLAEGSVINTDHGTSGGDELETRPLGVHNEWAIFEVRQRSYESAEFELERPATARNIDCYRDEEAAEVLRVEIVGCVAHPAPVCRRHTITRQSRAAHSVTFCLDEEGKPLDEVPTWAQAASHPSSAAELWSPALDLDGDVLVVGTREGTPPSPEALRRLPIRSLFGPVEDTRTARPSAGR